MLQYYEVKINVALNKKALFINFAAGTTSNSGTAATPTPLGGNVEPTSFTGRRGYSN